MKVSGVVGKVAGPNKGGFYSVKLEGDDNWYGAGKYPPKCQETDSVEFDAEQNDRGFWQLSSKTLRVMTTAAPPQATAQMPAAYSPKATPAPAGAKGLTKDDYWRRREDADVEDRAYRRNRDERTQNEIRFQAARNAAIEFLGRALESGNFTVPESKSASTSKLRSMKLQLDKITQEFYDDTLAVNKAPEKEGEAKEGNF